VNLTDPRYRKWAIAVAGVLAQVVGVLATAQDAGILPESWRPWIVPVIAIATALGVRQVENAPMVAARKGDGSYDVSTLPPSDS
jgi:hypothetical protein